MLKVTASIGYRSHKRRIILKHTLFTQTHTHIHFPCTLSLKLINQVKLTNFPASKTMLTMAERNISNTYTTIDSINIK